LMRLIPSGMEES